MARPRKAERPESLRERIVDVATALFADQGYAETSLAEIARAVGIRAQSIANHFASKEDLYDAVVSAFYRRQIADLGPIEFGSADNGAALLAKRFSALSVRDRNMLVTITAEALVAGRGAEVIDREFGPVVDVMVSALSTDANFPARELVALVILGMVFALDAPRIPPPTRALRDRMLGERPRMEEAGRLLLSAILPATADPAPPR
jgi:AcrR family transcriptional regulator